MWWSEDIGRYISGLPLLHDGVVRAAGWAVGRDELLDEFLDDGVGGIIGGELADVFGGFESDHGLSPILRT